MNTFADIVFKAALVIILGVFLWLYAEGRNVGRYAYYREGELEYVLDTSTGVVYQGGYWMDHVTGKEGPSKK